MRQATGSDHKFKLKEVFNDARIAAFNPPSAQSEFVDSSTLPADLLNLSM